MLHIFFTNIIKVEKIWPVRINFEIDGVVYKYIKTKERINSMYNTSTTAVWIHVSLEERKIPRLGFIGLDK
jgi:hypothetical protein